MLPVASAAPGFPAPVSPSPKTCALPAIDIVPPLNKVIRAVPPVPLPAVPPLFAVPPTPVAKIFKLLPKEMLLPTEAAVTALPPNPAPPKPLLAFPPCPAAWISVAPLIDMPLLAAT